MNNDGRSFTTAPTLPSIWSNQEDRNLMRDVHPSAIESLWPIEVSNLCYPGNTANELNAGNNALNAGAAEEAQWSKEEVDVLLKVIINWLPPENKIEWWMNLYSLFPNKTQDQVNIKYQTLLNEIGAENEPDTEPNRLELIPSIVSDQTLLHLPFSDANSDDYSYSYGIQNLNTETATAPDVVLPDPQPGAHSNGCGYCYGNQNLNIQTAMNYALPLALPMSCDSSNSYGNLNTTAGGYFPMDSNQQPQVIQSYNFYYGKENQNPNYVVNQILPFTAFENRNPYFSPTVNYDNNHHTNNLVSFPTTSNPIPNPNPDLSVVGFRSNQVTHPNLNICSSLPSHVTKASSSSTSVLQPLSYNYQNLNMVSNRNDLQRNMKKADRGCYWSVQEHTDFLSGVAQYGWGDWRSISRKCLKTKKPAQIASHAQKYQLRHYGPNTATRKRRSIHDITLSSNGIEVPPPRLPQTSTN